MYALSFDMVVSLLEKHYGKPYNKVEDWSDFTELVRGQ